MLRLTGPGLISMIGFFVWIYAIFDSIATDSALVRNLPKTMWVLLVIFLGPIGALAWLGLGRPKYAGWRPGDTTVRRPSRPIGLEDTDSWTSGRPPMAPAPRPSEEELAAKERRLAEWEAELRRREDGGAA